MAGKRMISNAICTSEKLAKVSHAAFRLWVSLLSQTDDFGNFHGNARIVWGQCVPLVPDMTPDSVETLIQELEDVRNGDPEDKGLIELYEDGGKRYIHLTNFENWQILRSDRPKDQRHPNPFESSGIALTTIGIPLGVNGMPEVKISKEKIREDKITTVSGLSGRWETLKRRYRNKYRTSPVRKPEYEPAYLRFCEQVGEDKILDLFDTWADDNPSSDPKFKKFQLTNFFRALPDLIDDAEFNESEPIPGLPAAPDFTELDRTRKDELNKKLEKDEKEEAYAKAHEDEI